MAAGLGRTCSGKESGCRRGREGDAIQSLMALAGGLLPPGLDAEKFGVPEVAKYGLGEEAKALGGWARPKGACFDTEEIQKAMRGGRLGVF